MLPEKKKKHALSKPQVAVVNNSADVVQKGEVVAGDVIFFWEIGEQTNNLMIVTMAEAKYIWEMMGLLSVVVVNTFCLNFRTH